MALRRSGATADYLHTRLLQVVPSPHTGTANGIRMSKIIELTDEQYAAICHAAKERRQSPAMLIAEVAEELRDPERTPRYFETDEWLRHLGVSEDRIRLANERIVRSETREVNAHPR
jgi:hypothetical protein